MLAPPPSENCAVCGDRLTDEVGWIAHRLRERAWCYGKHEEAEVDAAVGPDTYLNTLVWRFPTPRSTI